MLGFISTGTEKAVTTQEEVDATEFAMGDTLIADGGIETIWPGPVQCQNAAYKGPRFPVARKIFSNMKPNQRVFNIQTLRSPHIIIGTPRTPEQVMAQTSEEMLRAMHQRLSPARIGDFIDAINTPEVEDIRVRTNDKLADIELLLLSAAYGEDLMAILNDINKRREHLAKIQATAKRLMAKSAGQPINKAPQSPPPHQGWLSASASS